MLGYDLSRGLRPQAGSDAERLRAMVQYLTARWGEPASWPREPDKVLLMLEALIERKLVEDPANRKSIAVLFEYAQYLVPAGDLDSLARGQAARLVRFLSWAQNPHIKRVNIAFCLVADRLAEVNERLVQNPARGGDRGPAARPRRAARASSTGRLAAGKLAKLTDFSPDQLADMSNGLSLVNLNVVLVAGGRTPSAALDAQRFRAAEEDDDRAAVPRAGRVRRARAHARPGRRLRRGQAAAAGGRRAGSAAARLDAAPMGYLICGPVGHRQDVPGRVLRRLDRHPLRGAEELPLEVRRRDRRQLQQVLTVLRSLGPVVVIVDEADAAWATARPKATRAPRPACSR